jgi:Rieske Fe-S protein
LQTRYDWFGRFHPWRAAMRLSKDRQVARADPAKPLLGSLPMATVTQRVARRDWLGNALRGTIAVTLGAIFYPVVWFLRPRRAPMSGALEVVAPFKVNELANTKGNPFNFAGTACLVVLMPEGNQRLARGEPLQADDVRAFNAVCTHMECTVAYRSDKGDIFCNCHEGVFDLNGRNVSGPPPRPLERYDVALRGKPGQEEIIVARKTT